MPQGAKKHCPRGHKAFVGRRCPECNAKYEQERGNAFSRGYDNDWKRFRLGFLALNPNCSHPGCGEKATDVDHIVALAAGGAKLDASNCRSFCHKHHSARTGRDQVKAGRGRL